MKQNGSGPKEITRLESALKKLEFDLQARYSEFGKSILEQAQREQKAVDLLVDQIIETRISLSDAKGEWQCPKCFAYNDANSKFCKHCGEKMPDEEKIMTMKPRSTGSD